MGPGRGCSLAEWPRLCCCLRLQPSREAPVARPLPALRMSKARMQQQTESDICAWFLCSRRWNCSGQKVNNQVGRYVIQHESSANNSVLQLAGQTRQVQEKGRRRGLQGQIPRVFRIYL